MDTKKLDLIAVCIIILIFAFTYFAFISESRAKIALLEETENMLMENVTASGDMTLELDRIKEEIDSIHKNLERFDRQLPKEKRIYDFLVEIDKLARDNSVTLESITPGTLQKGTLYSRVPIHISGNAGFKDFYRFLFRLENIPRITKIEGLQVKGLPEGNRTDIEIDLAVFVGGK